MITGPAFETFTDAYLAVLGSIFNHPEFTAAAMGKPAIETTNVSFTITDPTARTAYLAARKANIVFNHAETLWYLSGNEDLGMIAYYAPTLRKLSADGKTLTGTAYGPRLFAPSQAGGLSQFDRVLNLLRQDPGSKRAAMMIMQPDELADPANPDVACTLGLQFLLRAGRLHMSAYMRGNDAVVGLLGDTFAFTMIQEFAARLLGVPVGTYAHHAGSMHINLPDLPKVEAILADQDRAAFPPSAMPASANWTDLQTVLGWERRLRLNQAQFTPDLAGIDAYWKEIIGLFEVYRQITHHPGEPVTSRALAVLRPGHRWLIERRWPSRMPATVPS